MRNKKLIILFSVLCAVVLLVVLSSVIFSVQKIEAHCENLPDEGTVATREAILQNHGIKKGSSIFTLSKAKTIATIESNVANVEVLSIEKAFPNKVYINYIELEEVYGVTANGKFLICSKYGKILRSIQSTDPKPNITELRLSELPASEKIGQNIFASNSVSNEFIQQLSDAFTGLGYTGANLNKMIKTIDLTGERVVLNTQSGTVWEIIGKDRIARKLQMTHTVFLTLTVDQQKTGKIITEIKSDGTASSHYVP